MNITVITIFLEMSLKYFLPFYPPYCPYLRFPTFNMSSHSSSSPPCLPHKHGQANLAHIPITEAIPLPRASPSSSLSSPSSSLSSPSPLHPFTNSKHKLSPFHTTQRLKRIHTSPSPGGSQCISHIPPTGDRMYSHIRERPSRYRMYSYSGLGRIKRIHVFGMKFGS